MNRNHGANASCISLKALFLLSVLTCGGFALAEPPNAKILFPPYDFVYAAGVTVQMGTLGDQDDLTYVWTLSDGTTLNGANVEFTVSQPGPVTVTMVATNTAGESSVPDDRIIYFYDIGTFQNAPVITSLTASSSSVTSGSPVTFDVAYEDPDSEEPFSVQWFWLENDRPKRFEGPSLTLRPTLTGDFQSTLTISVIVVDQEGNPSLTPGFTTVQVVPGGQNLPPNGRIVEPADDQIKVATGSTVTFRAEGDDPEGDLPLTFEWTFPDESSTTENPATFTFTELGLNFVTLSVTDSKGNRDPASHVVIVEVAEPSSENVTVGVVVNPLFSTRIFADESLILSGFPAGVDRNRPGSWTATNLITGEVAARLEGNNPGRLKLTDQGLYEIFYFFEEFGAVSERSTANVRWVSVQARDTNQPPTLDYDGPYELVARNGTEVSMNVIPNDPEGTDLRYVWAVEGVVQPQATGTSFSFTPQLESEDFFKGVQVLSVVAMAVDGEGKPTTLPLAYAVYVYEDRVPPRVTINDLPAGHTEFVPIGSRYDFKGIVSGGEGLDLIYDWRVNYLDRLTQPTLVSTDLDPEDPVLDRVGVLTATFNAETRDQTLRALYGATVWISVYDPAQKPETFITKPSVEKLTLETNQSLVFEGFVTDPNFYKGPESYFYERISNQMIWRVLRNGEDYGTYSQNEPLSLTFQETGTYTIILDSRNNVDLSPAQPDQLVVEVVEPRPDANFEPNNAQAEAANLELGSYSTFSVGPDDTGDWYAFQIDRAGAAIELDLDLREVDGSLIVEVFRGEDRVYRDELTGGRKHPFTFAGGDAGTYFLHISLSESAKHAKRMLSFGFTVTVSNPRLTFAYPKTDEVDLTSLALINPTGQSATATLIARDSEGNKLAEQTVDLAPRGHAERTVEGYFPGTKTLEISWVQVLSDQNVLGLATTMARDELTAIAEPAIIGSLDELVLPHIAQDTGQWFTRAAIVNTAGENVTAEFQAAAGNYEVEAFSDVHQSTVLDFESFFGGSLPAQGGEWGSFVEVNASPGLSGLEMFGTKVGSPRLCGLNLSSDKQKNPNFVFQGRDIYFPHVAADTNTFWTGIAFVNGGHLSTGVRLIAYNSAGQEVASRDMVLGPFEKQVGLAQTFFPDLAADAGVSWIRLQTDGQVHGYELFGDNDGDNTQLAGFPAVTGGSRELVFCKILFEPGKYYTGLAVVNLSSTSTAQLTYEVYDAAGSVLATANRSVGAFQKDVALVETIFGGVLPEGAVWVRLTSDQPLAGFQLMGDLEGKFMAASQAQ
ncbi:PKD domain-containing protein [Sulfidibacter corallicola]|uniref:PKD domain-containing protein n=1 Tax=Sulfidibacter corallicola TaxID=2818388 RepID=A0A8A4TX12_SULCO|nr:PKD domain-containing protein [Sulfidibacter corallicola]QTD51055.1 PKD domain-containing protein [Sulfidibacter corallicola]